MNQEAIFSLSTSFQPIASGIIIYVHKRKPRNKS